jgi:hypothetical protein
MDCHEPHPAPNEKMQGIQWTERPTGALVAAGSLWPRTSPLQGRYRRQKQVNSPSLVGTQKPSLPYEIVVRAYVLYLPFYFIGPYTHTDRNYGIGSNFWKFYVIRTGFILDEQVFLVKVFRLFRLDWIFFGVENVDTGSRCTTSYLFAGPAFLRCLVLFVCCIEIFQIMCLITLLILLESSQ